MKFIKNCSDAEKLKAVIDSYPAVMIGAGAGLSASAGLTYSGRRFQEHFGDFIKKYGLTDMYSAGFYPFATAEEKWAYWSRHIWYNRYETGENGTYENLLRAVAGKDYFVLTTNVDHCFQKAGFDKSRLFYTQGDYGLWQCSLPCHQKTYDNEEAVRRMIDEQRDMKIPTELIPHCPVCGRQMSMNLRTDDTFVEDTGWHAAAKRYEQYVNDHRGVPVLYLELGVGQNTPGIIKYNFCEQTQKNPQAFYVCVNSERQSIPEELEDRAICLRGDIGSLLRTALLPLS